MWWIYNVTNLKYTKFHKQLSLRFPIEMMKKKTRQCSNEHGHSLRSLPSKKRRTVHSPCQGPLFVWVKVMLPLMAFNPAFTAFNPESMAISKNGILHTSKTRRDEYIIMSRSSFYLAIILLHPRWSEAPQRFWSLYIYFHPIPSHPIPTWHIQEAARFFKACIASMAALAGSVATAWRATMVVNLGHDPGFGKCRKSTKKMRFISKKKMCSFILFHENDWDFTSNHFKVPKNPTQNSAQETALSARGGGTSEQSTPTTFDMLLVREPTHPSPWKVHELNIWFHG